MYSVRLFDGLDEPDLVHAWTALSRSGVFTNFQTLDYVRPMVVQLRKLAEAEPVFVVVYKNARAKDALNQPVLILPLAKKHHFGIVRLDFLDYWVADHQLPIFDPAAFAKQEDLSGLHRAIKQALKGYDLLAIRAMPKEWQGVANPLEGLAGEAEDSSASYRLALDDESLAKARKQSSVYKQCRRARRRLESELGVELVEIKDQFDIDSAFDAMIQQREAKYSDENCSDNFANEEVQNFFRELAHKHIPQNRAIMVGFRKGDAWVGVTFANALNDMVVGQLFSAAPGPWMKFGLGNVSLCYEIEWAKENGFKHYDFGAGTEAYKERFGGELCHQYSSMQALTASGRMYMAALDQKNRARRMRRSLRGHLESLSRPKPTSLPDQQSA